MADPTEAAAPARAPSPARPRLIADTDLFARALQLGPVDAAVAALPEPQIVFTGAIVANKLDLALIEGVCARRPQCYGSA